MIYKKKYYEHITRWYDNCLLAVGMNDKYLVFTLFFLHFCRCLTQSTESIDFDRSSFLFQFFFLKRTLFSAKNAFVVKDEEILPVQSFLLSSIVSPLFSFLSLFSSMPSSPTFYELYQLVSAIS